MKNSADEMMNESAKDEKEDEKNGHISDTSQEETDQSEGQAIGQNNNSDYVENIVVSSLSGLIEGTALGDSLGLPYEGLSHQTIIRSFSKSLEQSFLFGFGMLSDDTEQTVLVAQSLIAGRNDPRRFLRSFARRYRYWILCFPPGMGGASARAGIKLLLGFSPRKSGVFSAGNGPAMRSGIIGAYYYDQPERRRQFVRLATEMTHTDPKALTGALAVAEVAALIVRRKREGLNERPDLDSFIALLSDLARDDSAWTNLLAEFRSAFEKNENPLEFARRIGAKNGVSGYVYQTVPVALYIWYYNYYLSFGEVMMEVITCGGDTDTVGAIAGALAGCRVHPSMIEKTKDKISENKISSSKIFFSPIRIYERLFYRERGHFALANHLVPFSGKGQKWRNRIIDFPYSMGYLDRLSASLFHSKYEENIPVPFWHLFIRPIRNIFFLFLVLGHVVLRFRHVVIKIFDPRNRRYQKNLKKLLDRDKESLQESDPSDSEGNRKIFP